MNSDSNLICFKAISNFVNELEESFAKKHRPLKLYARLVNKTTFSHEKAMNKHIQAFNKFCVSNRQSIIDNSKDLEMALISYSNRVFINMEEIFKLTDKETEKMIWQHLLYISALVDPAGKAKEILKENMKTGKTGNSEANFLTDIIDKVEKNVDPNANPMEAVSSIMQSGIFTDLIGSMNNGISNGSLDMGKLMGAVQGMVGQLGEKTSGDPDAENAMNMINTMMSNMGGLSGKSSKSENPKIEEI